MTPSKTRALSDPLKRVFVGATLEQLLKLMTEQGDEILAEAGVTFPPRAAPTVLLLMKGGPKTAADLAKELDQPHQLVTQRVEALIASGVVARTVDPSDARRKILIITDAGSDQLLRLSECLEKIENAYVTLFDELGCDVAAIAIDMFDELTRRSLRDRIAD